MKMTDLNLNHSQQLILTGALGLLGTVVVAFKNKPEVWTLAAYESAVISGLAVAWTLLPKQVSEIEGEKVSKPEERVVPSFRL
jgi:hypothetical protein